MRHVTHIPAALLIAGALIATSCTGQGQAGTTATTEVVSTVTRPVSSTAGVGSSTTTAVTGTTSAVTAPDPGGQIIVYLDGWSAANLETVTATWQPDGAAASTVVAGPVEAATLATADEQAVTQLAARLVTSDPTLTCDVGGCATATRHIGYETLTRPGDLGDFGAVYRARGIDVGVWVFHLSGNSGTFTVGAGAMTLTSGGDEQVDGINGPSNGWKVGQYALAYAFGRLFALDAGWLRYDADGTTSYAPPAPASGTPVEGFDPDDLTHGLGTPLDPNLTAGMTDQTLTYLTSPTTGCYIGVLCVPGVAEPTVTVTNTHIVDVCDTDGHTGVVTLAGLDLTYDYTAPTHQFGMWNAGTPDGMFPDGSGSNLWASDPPLIDGPSAQHHAIAVLVDAAGIAAVTGGSFQVGIDSPEYDRFVWDTGDITRLFQGWEPCR